MSLVDALGLAVPASFFLGLLVEALRPARAQVPVRGWRFFGIAGFLTMAFVGSVPAALLAPYATRLALLPLARLGLLPAVVLGYLLYSLLSFMYHYACHHSALLWRLCHQLHHSPPRMDLSGAAFFHPFDMLVYALLTSVVTVVLGLDPTQAAVLALWAACFGFFQHMNVRTPRWLGYLVQRPEAHAVHHERDVHAWNYSDLPLWDLLFGTFRNPPTFHDRPYGFDEARGSRWSAMLRFVDVSR